MTEVNDIILGEDANCVELNKKLDKLQNDNDKMCKEINTLNDYIVDLKKQNAQLLLENNSCNNTISLLKSTSKAELLRKDNIILQLRKEMEEVLCRLTRNIDNDTNQDMEVQKASEDILSNVRGPTNKCCKRRHTDEECGGEKRLKTDDSSEQEKKSTIITINVNDVTMEIKRNNVNMNSRKNTNKPAEYSTTYNTNIQNDTTNENCRAWLERCENTPTVAKTSKSNNCIKISETGRIKRNDSQDHSENGYDSDATLQFENNRDNVRRIIASNKAKNTTLEQMNKEQELNLSTTNVRSERLFSTTCTSSQSNHSELHLNEIVNTKDEQRNRSEQDKREKEIETSRICADTSIRLVKEIVDSVSNGINSILQNQNNKESSVINIFDGATNKSASIIAIDSQTSNVPEYEKVTAASEEMKVEITDVLDRDDIQSIDTVFFDANSSDDLTLNTLRNNLSAEISTPNINEIYNISEIEFEQNNQSQKSNESINQIHNLDEPRSRLKKVIDSLEEHVEQTSMLTGIIIDSQSLKTGSTVIFKTKKCKSKPRTSHEHAIEFQERRKRKRSKLRDELNLLNRCSENTRKLDTAGNDTHSSSSVKKRHFDEIKNSSSNNVKKLSRNVLTLNNRNGEKLQRRLSTSAFTCEWQQSQRKIDEMFKTSKITRNSGIPANINNAHIKLTKYEFEELEGMIIIKRGHEELSKEIKNIKNIKKIINKQQDKNTSKNIVLKAYSKDKALSLKLHNSSKNISQNDQLNIKQKNIQIDDHLPKKTEEETSNNVTANDNIKKIVVDKNNQIFLENNSKDANFINVTDGFNNLLSHKKVNVNSSASIDNTSEPENQLPGSNMIATEFIEENLFQTANNIKYTESDQNNTTADNDPNLSNKINNTIDDSTMKNLETLSTMDAELSKQIKTEILEGSQENDETFPICNRDVIVNNNINTNFDPNRSRASLCLEENIHCDKENYNESVKMEIIEIYEEADMISNENTDLCRTDVHLAKSTAIDTDYQNIVEGIADSYLDKTNVETNTSIINSDDELDANLDQPIISHLVTNKHNQMDVTQIEKLEIVQTNNNEHNVIVYDSTEAGKSAANISSVISKHSHVVGNGETTDATEDNIGLADSQVQHTEPNHINTLSKEFTGTALYSINTVFLLMSEDHNATVLDISGRESVVQIAEVDGASSITVPNDTAGQVHTPVEIKNNVSNTNIPENNVKNNSNTIAVPSLISNILNAEQNQTENTTNLHLESVIKTEVSEPINEDLDTMQLEYHLESVIKTEVSEPINEDLDTMQLEYLRKKMIECRHQELTNLHIEVDNLNKENIMNSSNLNLSNNHGSDIKTEPLNCLIGDQSYHAQENDNPLNSTENVLLSPKVEIKTESPGRTNAIMSTTKSTYQMTVVDRNVSIVSIRRRKIKKEKLI